MAATQWSASPRKPMEAGALLADMRKVVGALVAVLALLRGAQLANSLVGADSICQRLF